MTPVSVLHLIWSFEIGGAEKFVMNFVRNLDRTRYEPSICAFADDGPLRAEAESLGVPILTVRRGTTLLTALRLRRVLKTHKPHLIHAHSLAPGFYAAVAGRLTRTPVLTTRHGRPEESAVRSIVRSLSNRLTDRFVAVSEEVRQLLIAHSGIASEKIFAVVNGIDTARFAGPRDVRLREELGIPAASFLYGTVGRLSVSKAHGDMIRAMKILSDQGRDVRLIIAGDGNLRSKMEDLVAELGLQDRVKLVGSRNDVPALLHSLDAFVLSSVDEGVPLSLLEAMAAGLPVVATEVGGVPEVVRDGHDGLLVKPGDVQALAAAMARIMSEPDLAQRIAVAGADTVRERFSIESMINNYCRHYQILLDEHREPTQQGRTWPARLPSPGRLSRSVVAAAGLLADAWVANPVLVLESDDWGQTGAPDLGTYNELLRAGATTPRQVWSTDALETVEDIGRLSEALSTRPDGHGRTLPVTANFIMSNPDVAAIVSSDGAECPFIGLSDDRPDNPVDSNLRSAWLNAMKSGLLCPEYHGLWHFAPEALGRAWTENAGTAREYLERGSRPAGLTGEGSSFLLSEYMVVRRNRLGPRPFAEQAETVKGGVSLFTNLFGRTPSSTVAPHYLWDDATETVWREAGIISVQAANRHLSVRGRLGFLHARSRSMGRRRPAGLVCLTRNCRFEPALYADTAGGVLPQVRAAFDSHRPAVISCHRINFSGRLFPDRRDKTLDELGQLLDRVRDLYPNVTFLTSAELAGLLLKRAQERVGPGRLRTAAARFPHLLRRAFAFR